MAGVSVPVSVSVPVCPLLLSCLCVTQCWGGSRNCDCTFTFPFPLPAALCVDLLQCVVPPTLLRVCASGHLVTCSFARLRDHCGGAA
jgi:hypothetical protein